MRRLWWTAILVVVVSACGGTASDGDSSSVVDGSGGVVESADGLATLSLPDGSLPPDVSVDDVGLEAIVDEDAVLGAPVVAVRLSPDGLLLGEAAELTVTIPEALDGGFMVIHVSGDTIEFLDGAVKLVDDRLSFVTSISHFSVVNFNNVRITTGSMVLTPAEVTVGQTQQADATVTLNEIDSVPLFIHFNSDPGGSWRKFEFSAPKPPFRFDQALPSNSSRVYWDNQVRGEFWDPDAVEVDFSKTDTGWKIHAASTCTKENQHNVFLTSEVQFKVEVLAAGPPVETNFLNFSQVFTQAAIDTFDSGIGSIALLDSSPGDIIEAKAYLYAQAPTVCTGAGAGSGSSTDPPGGHESSPEAVDLGPRSSQNPANTIDAAGQSSPVAINADDCFNDDGIVECTAAIDVIALFWEEVEGAADLLSLTAAFAGPVDGGGDIQIDVGIWPRGNGSPLGTRIGIVDGVFSCKFPGSDGPLPGESCQVNDDGEIVVVRDISRMSGRIDVTIRTIHFAEDGALIRDAARIEGILNRE